MREAAGEEPASRPGSAERDPARAIPERSGYRAAAPHSGLPVVAAAVVVAAAAVGALPWESAKAVAIAPTPGLRPRS